MGDGRKTRGKPQVKKAAFESTKKKEIGVSDLTLLSKVSNEAINDNLKLRFENREIYVRVPLCAVCIQICTNFIFHLQTYIGHVLVSVNPFRDCTFLRAPSCRTRLTPL